MGASGWSYAVPYQSDVDRALRDVQRKVLEAGDFATLGSKAEMVAMYQEQLAKVDQELEDESLKEAVRQDILQRIEGLESMPEPTSMEEKIAELRAVNAEAGTHSILDMHRVSEDRSFGSVSPVRDAELNDLFGTSKPTREMVEGGLDELMANIPRWTGRYVVVYRGDHPDQIVFVGVSGD